MPADYRTDITPSTRLDGAVFVPFIYGIIQMLVVSSSIVKKEVKEDVLEYMKKIWDRVMKSTEFFAFANLRLHPHRPAETMKYTNHNV